MASAQPQQSGQKFELGSLLGYRLARLSAAIGTLAEQEAQEVAGLTLPEYRVLAVLHSTGSMGVVALQRAMMLDKAWISRTLSKLVDKGLATSQADTLDARRTTFSVTDKGKHVAQTLIERAFKRQARIFNGFAEHEVVALMEMLSRIQENVEAQ